ncbi:MAG: bacillithiol system redox-active protein YtxJ [Flavobacteriia bacterium]|nr:bacillithiol system redox-active protein YtxJ [Flavobacteriia bacterium]OJX37256.1 MAG: hypothetical protein BGO87_01030 [Flavobacteriia bacterium 40-80]
MFFSASALNWINPATTEELDVILNDTSKPLIVFKHSTRCSISGFALKQFEREYDLQDVNLVFIDVLKQRELSNHIAEKWNIVHQSPQTLIQRTSGEHTSFSHEGIAVSRIKQFLGL